MSGGEADKKLLALLRKSERLDANVDGPISDFTVLKDAEFIYNNSIDVAIDSRGTNSAAAAIWTAMRKKGYSQKSWSAHELHPKTKDDATVNFILTMDLLNFSFWPESPSEAGYMVDYRGKQWTGYWSLVAVLQRALSEGISVSSELYLVSRG